MEAAPPFLSIVIPAHNEEDRLVVSLQKIDTFLQTQSYQSEVIVVENASTDRTLLVAERWAADHTYVRVIQEPVRGKGHAVRRGMLEARGQFRFMCDADLSMPIEQVSRFLPPVLNDFDIAIGSRAVPGARRIGEPFYRFLRSRVFAVLVSALALKGFQDTQCGFKCFRERAAANIFSVQRIDGFGFDVEVLFIAQMLGYKVIEVPIDWYYMPAGHLRPIADPLQMVRDLITIRKNWRAGKN